jgi:hypothetical protein
MAHSKNNKSILYWIEWIINNVWWIILILAVVTLVCGTFGFWKHSNCCNGFYESVRLLILNHQFEIGADVNCWLQWARWLALLTFVLFSFRVYLLLIPEWWTKVTIKGFRNHIIICGLTPQSLMIANHRLDMNKDNKKFRVVFIDNIPENPLHNSIRDAKAHLIKNDINSRTVLKSAGIFNAREVMIFAGTDAQKVESARIVRDLLTLTPHKRKVQGELLCRIHIDNLAYSHLLKDNKIFKNIKPNLFDGQTFNLSELNVKNGLICYACILFDTPQMHLLIVGLNAKSKSVIENLAHFLNTSDYASKIKITVIEEDIQEIREFQCLYGFMDKFVDISFIEKPVLQLSEEELREIKPTGIYVCLTYETEIFTAMRLRLVFKEQDLPTFVFSDAPTTEAIRELPLEERNIFIVSLETIKPFLFDEKKRLHIDYIAKQIHDDYRKNGIAVPEYSELTYHYMQSNIEAALDFYKKWIYLKIRRKYSKTTIEGDFSEEEKELLKQIEHRRWMIEKYLDGFTYAQPPQKGKKLPEKCKSNLLMWDDLNPAEKNKDGAIISLLNKLIKEGKIDENDLHSTTS